MTTAAELAQINSQPDHNPVLLREMLEYLSPKYGGKYLDCTFGAGGYSRAILESAGCEVVALDQDPTVAKFVKSLEADFPERFKFMAMNFAEAAKNLADTQFDGIVLDIGVSSMQLDIAERGFSFLQDGPLDMRMNPQGLSAAEFIASASEEEIADVIYKYGEEHQSRKIARRIVEERAKSPITTTLRLAGIVRGAIGHRPGKIDPATKTFQAIRIYINKELEVLEKFLESVYNLLADKGRLVVVSFHSLEDSIVKDFFKEHSAKKVARSKYAKEPVAVQSGKWLNILTKRPVAPTNAELNYNRRSRSAKLRAAEKIGGINADR